MENLIYVLPLFGILALVYMFYLSVWVNKQEVGDEKMKQISTYIREGAMAFLKAEYRVLALFVLIAGILLGIVSAIVPTTHWFIVVAFVIGAVFSAIAGNIGMRIATAANVRTTQAARTSLQNALNVSFKGGTVMGLGVAGLAVFGLSILFIILSSWFVVGKTNFYDEMTIVLEALAGFSLGAESIALFARVGGGIYTKAADVGADLVGKVEAGIPEDDPRNPATIADNVGDNVGDVAGMGADLFGSYVATVLASMVLGNYLIKDLSNAAGEQFADAFNGMGPILLPILIAGLGILFSIIGTFFVKISGSNPNENDVQSALNKGNWVSIALTAIASFFIIKWMLPETLNMVFFGEGVKEISALRVFYAVLVGLTVGGLISYFTEYYTGLGKSPVLAIVQKSSTGAGTNIIAGLATGMISTFYPILLFASAIWGAYAFAGFYGVAIAASAMMATTAMQLAIDAFGPIADNAGGIAEMSELPKEVRTKTDILDSVGNTTAAIGKGFAIASAALTALALFAAYVTFTGIDGINIFKAPVLACLFVGGMVPVVFSALAMNSVGKAAMDMVKEVRRQFKEIPGIMEGTGQPEYGKCVEISTKAALREMMLPGVLTISMPIIIAFLPILFGYENAQAAEMLGGYMAGVTVSGVLWAIFQNNAGGAWDNAKKSFEAGVMIDGQMTYKGSDAHKAAVTGDTVGDPFKDTSGPSMNILIKLTCLIGLVIAPILGGHTEKHEDASATEISIPEVNDEIEGVFQIKTPESTISWIGKSFKGEHHGTLQLVSGGFQIANGNITAGDIIVDMKSIVCSDITDENDNADLIKHLASDDFFSTEKFSTASLILLSSENKGNNTFSVSGNLTIKDITQPVNFDITLAPEGNKFKVTAKLEVDRTLFEIKYKSKKFGALADNFIYDNFLLEVNFVAEK
jgi:K(+)-stimulated pyrophosphate-energized sodium pump